MTSSNLDIAIKWAESNPITNLPRMACCLSDGRSFFIGLNSRKTHPLQKRFSTHPERICTHAEIDAISKAISAGSLIYHRSARLSTGGASFLLSVARVHKNGQKALAQPCPGCMRAIKHFKIKRVEWT